MPKRLNLLGQKFNRLKVIGKNPVKAPDGRTRWICVCECGKQTSVSGSYLVNSNTKSCGCYRTERMSKAAVTHGMTDTSEYSTWVNIKQLCSDKTRKNYGAKGIKVCDRWMNSFENFLEDMGMKPSPKHQLRRLDKSKDYTLENCKWISAGECKDSTPNTVSSNAKTTGLSEWSKYFGHITESHQG